jgi:hypothetical protein
MRKSKDQFVGIKEAVRSAKSSGRLLALVDNLIRELNRLEEDNRQLRAAVSVYQEVARRLQPTVVECRDTRAVPAQQEPSTPSFSAA